VVGRKGRAKGIFEGGLSLASAAAFGLDGARIGNGAARDLLWAKAALLFAWRHADMPTDRPGSLKERGTLSARKLLEARTPLARGVRSGPPRFLVLLQYCWGCGASDQYRSH
jgi:hypothetical protein